VIFLYFDFSEFEYLNAHPGLYKVTTLALVFLPDPH